MKLSFLSPEATVNFSLPDDDVVFGEYRLGDSPVVPVISEKSESRRAVFFFFNFKVIEC